MASGALTTSSPRLGIGFLTLARLIRALAGRLGPHELAEFAGDYSGNPSHDLKGHLE